MITLIAGGFSSWQNLPSNEEQGETAVLALQVKGFKMLADILSCSRFIKLSKYSQK